MGNAPSDMFYAPFRFLEKSSDLFDDSSYRLDGPPHFLGVEMVFDSTLGLNFRANTRIMASLTHVCHVCNDVVNQKKANLKLFSLVSATDKYFGLGAESY